GDAGAGGAGRGGTVSYLPGGGGPHHLRHQRTGGVGGLRRAPGRENWCGAGRGGRPSAGNGCSILTREARVSYCDRRNASLDKIYVTGHRNPDTDSIVSAMAYAALRNAVGDREYV